MNSTRTIAVDRLFEDLKSKVDGLQLEDQESVEKLFAELDRVVTLSGTEGLSSKSSQQLLLEVYGQVRQLLLKSGVDSSKWKTSRSDDIAEIPVNRPGKEDGTDSPDAEGVQALVGEDLSRYESLLDAEDKPVDHDAVRTDDPVIARNFASAGQIALELGVDKSTITRRIKKNALIGYQGFKRDWLIPREQFKDGNVVPGIAETIELFESEHRQAWLFLSSGFFYGDADPRPIDRLRALKSNDREGLEACLAELESVKLGIEYGVHF